MTEILRAAQRPGGGPRRAARRPGDGMIVTVLCLGGLLAALMQSLVVPIVGRLPHLLGTSADNASWVITATLLASSVAMPIAGRAADLYGKRRVLLVSLVSLIAGSLLCALSSTLLLTVAGRTLQGLAMGLVPVGISLMRDELHAERIPAAVALMSAMLGVGGAIGIPFGAYISEHFDYHALFWVALGAGAIVAALMYVVVPESPVTSGARFDAVGAAGVAAGLVAVLLAITKGHAWGWTSVATIGCFVGGAAILIAWGAYELCIEAPLVDLRVSARPSIALTNLASVLVGFAMFALMLTMPQLLQLPSATGYGLGRGLLEAGLWMVPGGLVMMALSPVSARLTRTIGARTTLAAGAAVTSGGYFATLALRDTPWQLMIGSMIVFGGVGIAYSAMPALIMADAPVAESAAANGLNSLMRSVGTAIASAVVTSVLAGGATTLHGVAVPAKSGFTTVLILSGAIAAGATAVALCIPRRRRERLTPRTGTPVAGARRA
ncbi:MFS transporter [Tsukamurella sp. 8F]|uniref:MFS transporter n=1 Tax=unclassified Tsukamurella TaxID=2633480 RepID=UPI0023B9F825|nr:MULTISPECIES: MFS transporter [unclassified Tsukamurella]MDF0532360.1 MFS transporter [Tsukamurella sp. 8J]MDF0589368.1 MFS transporter [Tsukamurella sp. 8F]